MRKRKLKKMLVCLMTISLFGAFAMPSFADVEIPEDTGDVEIAIGDDTDGLEAISISTEDIEITEDQKMGYEELCEGLANAIGSSSNYEEAIQAFANNNDCSSQEAILTCIEEKVKAANDDDLGLPNVSLDNSVSEEFEKNYDINKTTKLTVTPTEIVVTKFKSTKKKVKTPKKQKSVVKETMDKLVAKIIEPTYAASTTWIQKYAESKTYYSWVGAKLYTIGMKCNFYYDGKKAWYKNGFNGYYKPYSDGLEYEMSNWKGTHEQSGKSHIAWVSGNVHYGIEYKGVGIIFSSKYVKHTVTCSKNGKVSCKYTIM